VRGLLTLKNGARAPGMIRSATVACVRQRRWLAGVLQKPGHADRR
jgi:hypothetical protein